MNPVWSFLLGVVAGVVARTIAIVITSRRRAPRKCGQLVKIGTGFFALDKPIYCASPAASTCLDGMCPSHCVKHHEGACRRDFFLQKGA